MSYQKFIISANGHLRPGMVNMHKDLLQPGDECIGGGYYQFDYVSNRDCFGLKSLLIITNSRNVASQRIAEKFGFRFVSDYVYDGIKSKSYCLIL